MARLRTRSDVAELAFAPTSRTLVIDKPGDTCVTPGFLALLARRPVDEIHIAGIDTDACFTKYATDLFEMGLTPVVLTNRCDSTAGDAHHAAAFRILVRAIGSGQVR